MVTKLELLLLEGRGSVDLDDLGGCLLRPLLRLALARGLVIGHLPGTCFESSDLFFDLAAQFFKCFDFVRDFPGLFFALVDEAAYITNFLGEGLAFVRGKLTSSHGVPHSGTRLVAANSVAVGHVLE